MEKRHNMSDSKQAEVERERKKEEDEEAVKQLQSTLECIFQANTVDGKWQQTLLMFIF